MTTTRAGRAFAAVDLGATNGRVIIGRVEGSPGERVLRTWHIARFRNDPVRVADGLHWNVLELYARLLAGLAAAERAVPDEIVSVGVDSWAVDYGLLREGRLLGLPYHYRDGRTERSVATVHARVSASDLYAYSGLQHLPFNTLFQLAAEGDLLTFADRMLLIPDLIGFWLTGTEVAEQTNASTTGLLDRRSGTWNLSLAETIGIPVRLLPPIVEPGSALGSFTPTAAAAVGRALNLVAVGSHDTASAVVAVPTSDPSAAYISCGTWGLVGLDLPQAVLTEEARTAGFTNESGVDGRVRFLRNVMGLWLLSESLRQWEPGTSDAEHSTLLKELLAAAATIDSATVSVFDVDDPRFLGPGDIPGRIAGWCREHGERAPATRAEFVRSIVESLASAFATTVHRAAELANRDVTAINIVGGGSRNTLLCQATADRSGLPVVAGPAEATAWGNLLVQARSAGLVPPHLGDLRDVVARSVSLIRYYPR